MRCAWKPVANTIASKSRAAPVASTRPVSVADTTACGTSSTFGRLNAA